ncbi:CHC2 zinc finger domain-containing protein [Defluviimonas sp. D31]|uniref:DUF7146 domain-containing protein n=1 Tax=Defluviimonas sp. D31 TaxID=3083253 RepID=UPI00296EC37D|nr:CHC2 zinc finger domain-containing protein [Defluviimonas sp. D31]MDW4550868.1 CHC2 zinc finger domain-containing protein [Defluviimonas sp. D31]
MADDPRLALVLAMPFAEILDRLPLEGLRREARELVGPCPVCGGHAKRDADRFSINPDRGVFHCRGCQAGGDGIDLVRHVLGCDFKAALEHLAGKAQEVDPAERARRAARAAAAEAERAAAEERHRAQAIEDARAIWRRARPAEGSPVTDYLARRGIRLPVLPKSLRFLPDHPAVKKLGGRLVTLHRGPCMIAAIQGADDRLAAVHQTWLDLSRPGGKAEIRDPETGEALPAKMVRGSKKGGAIRLGGGGSDLLIMGEGIETTLSARVIAPMGPAVYWAGVDLGNLAGRMLRVPGRLHSGEPDLADARAFVPPVWVRRLVLIQDGDSDPDKTRAALLSGIRRAQQAIPGLAAWVVHPGAGRDLNDILTDEERQ